jgi:hypothetical protein
MPLPPLSSEALHCRQGFCFLWLSVKPNNFALDLIANTINSDPNTTEKGFITLFAILETDQSDFYGTKEFNYAQSK